MSLAKAFEGIKESKAPAPQLVATRPAVAGKGATAKSSNPDFEPVKVYLRRQTRKAAQRKWEDATGGDFSELVEDLLAKYLST
jgi:hypothetical protein